MDNQRLYEFMKSEFSDLKDMINDIRAEIARLNEKVGATKIESIQEDLQPELNTEYGFEMLDIKTIPAEPDNANTNEFMDLEDQNDFDDSFGNDTVSLEGSSNGDASSVDDTNGVDDANCADDASYHSDIINNGPIFPIGNLKTLTQIEREIANGALREYVSQLEDLFDSDGLKKGFCRLFTEDFIMDLNANGKHGKICLKSYPNLLRAIKQADTKSCQTTEKDFFTSIRKCIRLYKNKIYRMSSLARSKDDNHAMKSKRKKESISAIVRLAEIQEQIQNTDQEREITFPLKTFADLEYLNAKINENNKKEYIETLKLMFQFGGLGKNIVRFLHEDLLFHYNFRGVQGKLSFQVYTNLLDILYEASVENKEDVTRKEFYEELQHVFRTQKNRIHRKNGELRKMNKSVTKPMLEETSSQDATNLSFPTNDRAVSVNQDVKKYKHKFPLQTPFAVQMMDKMITSQNKHRFVKKTKELLGEKGLRKNFHRFMAEDLITQYNMTGTCNKLALKEATNVMDVLYEATYEEKNPRTRMKFYNMMQRVFLKYKNRKYKRDHAERERKKKDGSEND